MGRRRGALVVATVAAAAVVVGGVLAVTYDDRPRLEAGGQEPVETTGPLPGYGVPVLLPSGEILVKVTDPTTELPPPCCTDDDEADVRPPSGGSVVGIQVRSTSAVPGGVTRNVPVLNETELPEPTYTLVVEEPWVPGRDQSEPGRFEVASPPAGGELATWVAVDGVPDVDDLTVEVEYDGVVQVVDPAEERVDAQDASELYAAPEEPTRTGCGRVRAEEPGIDVGGETCTISLWSTPYLPGVGWSGEDGWLIASSSFPSVSNVRRDVNGERYLYTGVAFQEPGVSPELRLDGRAPDEIVSEGSTVGTEVVAWQVAGTPVGDRLEVSLDLPVEALSDPAPLATLSLGWSRRLPFLG